MCDAPHSMAPAHDDPPAGLHALLQLTPDGVDRYLAPTLDEGPGRLFGGQVAGQALLAACATVDPDRPPHSMHAYFLRGGRAGEPLELVVERTRDGRSFTTRRVTAHQHGRAVFTLLASFHADEVGEDWQVPAPAGVPSPEQLGPPMPTPISFWEPFDICPAAGPGEDGFPLRHPVWVRVRYRLPDDPVLHACALVWLTDIGTAPSSRAPGTQAARHPFVGASLDHAVWFHRAARADGWLLFGVEPERNGGGRGLVRGALHTPDGVRVASVVQEALVRPAGLPGREG
jgi:acyl-CoA thioesterase II